MSEPVYHVTTVEEWNYARIAGAYQADSLHSDGFIHLSTAEQLPRTLERYFAGRSGLAVLEIDPERLRWELRWEEADGESFPHLYGPLEAAAVISVQTL